MRTYIIEVGGLCFPIKAENRFHAFAQVSNFTVQQCHLGSGEGWDCRHNEDDTFTATNTKTGIVVKVYQHRKRIAGCGGSDPDDPA